MSARVRGDPVDGGHEDATDGCDAGISLSGTAVAGGGGGGSCVSGGIVPVPFPAIGADVYVSGGVRPTDSAGVDDVKPSDGGGDCGGMYIGMACRSGARVLPVPIVCSGLPPFAA